MDELREKANETLSHYKFPLLVGIIGVMFFGYGLISLISHEDKSDDISFIPGTENSASVKSVKSEKDPESGPAGSGVNLFIDVSGAVLNPGVYQLPENARIQDALKAAGGMNEDADRELVSKQINLAAKVQDGTKIYVPKIGETANNISTLSNVSDITASGKININSASQSELESLPGIGPVTAGKMIANRPYASVEDLLQKKAVSKSVFEKIKEKIVVY